MAVTGNQLFHLLWALISQALMTLILLGSSDNSFLKSCCYLYKFCVISRQHAFSPFITIAVQSKTEPDFKPAI